MSNQFSSFSNFVLDQTRLLAVALVCMFLLYWTTISSLIRLWWSSFDYGHGLIILPVSAYLVWRKRYQLAPARRVPQPVGMLLLVGFGLWWWVGYLVDINVVAEIAFFGMLGSLFLSFLGSRNIRPVLVPLLLPFIALPLPVWNPVRDVLQFVTTSVVSSVLAVSQIPVFVEGNMVQIPEGSFAIEDGCSGLRYMLAAMALGFIYSHVYLRGFRIKCFYIGIVFVLAMALNWLRVFLIVIAGHLTNMAHFLVYDHANFGWWLFAVILVPVFWFGNLLIKHESSTAGSHVSAKAADAGVPSAEANNGVRLPVILSVVVPIVFFPATGFYLKNVNDNRASSATLQLHAPLARHNWSGPEDASSDRLNPVFNGSVKHITVSYHSPQGDEIILYIAKYLGQAQGKELISDENHPYDINYWLPVNSETRKLNLPGHIQYEVNEELISAPSGNKRLLWYWYSIAGTITIHPIVGKMLQFMDILSGSPSSASVLIVAVDVTQDVEQARAELSDYIKAMHGALVLAADETMTD